MHARLGLVVSTALMILLPLDLVAAERATFVLRNGQRDSGVVVAHGDQQANLINGSFNLGEMPGGTGALQERAYPATDVLVIDFAGGTPSQQESAGLNQMNGQPHMLALRSGTVIYGRFDNIIGGATVSFDNQIGQRQTFGARDVARIYLDAHAARTLFNVQPDPVSSGQAGNRGASGNANRQPVGQGASTNANRQPIDRGSSANVNRQPIDRGSSANVNRQPTDRGLSATANRPAVDRGAPPNLNRQPSAGGPSLRVDATRSWTDTGIDVGRGERLSFRASGQIQFTDSNRDVAGPEGNSRYRIDPYQLPVRLILVGGLIGRVGSGAPFAIGSNTNPIVMPENGRLYLGPNDNIVTNNRGAFLVEILTGGR
jgi:hypothetical protein